MKIKKLFVKNRLVNRLEKYVARCPNCGWKISKLGIYNLLREKKNFYNYSCSNCEFDNFSLFVTDDELASLEEIR